METEKEMLMEVIDMASQPLTKMLKEAVDTIGNISTESEGGIGLWDMVPSVGITFTRKDGGDPIRVNMSISKGEEN